jgi:hypothetical protein
MVVSVSDSRRSFRFLRREISCDKEVQGKYEVSPYGRCTGELPQECIQSDVAALNPVVSDQCLPKSRLQSTYSGVQDARIFLQDDAQDLHRIILVDRLAHQDNDTNR